MNVPSSPVSECGHSARGGGNRCGPAGLWAGGCPVPGLVLVALGVLAASRVQSATGSVPLIVASVVGGAVIGNLGLVTADTAPGLSFAAKTLLRAGIVLLGLRLSLGDISALGLPVLFVLIATVLVTFFAVRAIGRKLGLSPALSLLVASGFSICGNSAIASVSSVAESDEEEVAAAIGLVTLCGTAAIFVVPTLGTLFGLTDMQLGVWAGAGVQDTAQVVAVASAAGPAVLAIATAVKLTRVLFLAPIVAGLSLARSRSVDAPRGGRRPALVPLFVVGFIVAILARTTGLAPPAALDLGRVFEQHLLAAGMVGLGSSVRVQQLRRLGPRPLLLGLVAWLVVGVVSLGTLYLTGV